MGSLPRRIAAVTVATAALLGAAGTAADASTTATKLFRAYGPNPSAATNRAWAAAHAAGFTDAQCSSEVEVIAPGYWEVIVTCVN
ncbi:hypothetical protein ACFVZ3_05745 [Kitasatospora purpeofusca]|uniref:hypothetical protein n=1 Tax=Kitasatospora purpeofusca TaxID=67352 RepID=UPI00365B06CC